MLMGQRVRDFHRVFGFPIDEPVVAYLEKGEKQILRDVAMSLESLQHECTSYLRDRDSVAVSRLRLVLEELAELTRALEQENPIEVADGLGDLGYVLYGTAVAYGLPLDALMAQIHISNMTKDPGAFKPVKGSRYMPPKISEVLHAHMTPQLLLDNKLK